MANQHYKLNINVNPRQHAAAANNSPSPAPEHMKQPVPEPEGEPAALTPCHFAPIIVSAKELQVHIGISRAPLFSFVIQGA